MADKAPRSLFSQTLTILDHPSDPMVIHFKLELAPAFARRGYRLEDLQGATLRLLSRHERLRTTIRCEPEAFRDAAEGPDQASELNDRAWSANGLDAGEFRQLAIPFEEAPLLRFKYVPGEALHVACHHSLMDGFGCHELVLALLGELEAPGVPPAPSAGVPAASPSWPTRLARFGVWVYDYLALSLEIGRNPTSLLGAPRATLRQRHHFATRSIFLSELRGLRDSAARRLGQPLTLNDLILAAFHLALADRLAARAAPDRISLTVPVNTRPQESGTPLFINRMGYVSLSTLAPHRASPPAALLRVRAGMLRAKRFRKEHTVELIMGLYERLGLLRLVRTKWLKHRLPTRYVGADAFFWKNLDTALVTNLGHLSFSPPHSEWIAGIEGFAPVISPTLSLAIVGYGDTTRFCLRHGSSVMDEREGAALLDRFVARLCALGDGDVVEGAPGQGAHAAIQEPQR